MSPDDPVSTVEVDGLGEQFTAEEQAQFDAMRQGGDEGEVQLPDPAPAPAPAPGATPPAAATPPETPPQPSDDDDIEVNAPVSGTKQKRVSIHKFQRMEERARQAEERAENEAKERAAMLDRLSRTDERLKIISEAMATPPEAQQQQQQDDPAPDPAKDIFAYAEWQGRQLQKLTERIDSLQSGAQAATADTEIATAYQRDAARFASTPEGVGFADAYVYLIKQRDAELQLAGVDDPKARERQIVSEEKGLVASAIKRGQSPAQMIFSLAKGRGFVPKAAPAPAPAPANGKDPKALDAPQAAPAPAPAPSVTAEIEAIRKGQEAAQSLSNVGGGAPPRELTSQVLADMPEEEFNDLVARLPRERLMELMGN